MPTSPHFRLSLSKRAASETAIERNARKLPALAWLAIGSLSLGCPQVLDDPFQVTEKANAGQGGFSGETALEAGRSGALGASRGGTGSALIATGGMPAMAVPSKDAAVEVESPDATADAAIAALDTGLLEDADVDASEASPTCVDGFQNQNETAIDCGGECASCLLQSLKHRYRFEGAGTVAIDSVGTQNGTLINATLFGDGNLTLNGNDAFVQLPAGVISGLSSTTIEVWLTWSGGPRWQRIFDFGSSTADGVVPQSGQTYLGLSPDGANRRVTALYSLDRVASETRLVTASALPSNRLVHLALVVDAINSTMSIYLDGSLDTFVALTPELSQLDDTNNWIGRSQFATDPFVIATYAEFRIYKRALIAAEVFQTFTAGPDDLP